MFGAFINSDEFIASLHAGVITAFELLWIEGARNVIPFLRSAGFADPEDIWQDCWVKLFRTNCRGYDRSEGEFPEWLLTVAKNRGRDRERKKKRSRTGSIEDIPEQLFAVTDENGSGDHNRVALLDEVLGRLDPDDREIIRLGCELGLKSPEMALRFGSSRVAIRKRKSRLLRKLKRQILRLEDNELRRTRQQTTGRDSP